MIELLKNVAVYSSDRINISELDIETYVSTENILQNKLGKTIATKLPASTNFVTKYSPGDILIGNIRPYLKKIWFAVNEGGSSADVLTIKVKSNSDPRFIYYALLRDDFFDYVMAGSKGTKMPRGDKNQVMNFKIPKFNLNTQSQIAKVLSDLDAKIELNNKINTELEAMAKLIYDYWFVQFEFPCLPQDYRPSGQVNPNSELSEKIRAFCTYKQTGGLPLPNGKTWFVYVLLCDDGSFYKGMTNDLYRRYFEHGSGQGAQHTKTHKPIRVIHWEAFENQEMAAEREKELKTGFGRTWLQREFEYLQNQKPGSPAHQNARLSKLMPAGKMVWNEELKREVPEGWEVKEIQKLIDVKDGTHDSPKSKEIGYPLITSKNLKPSGLDYNEANLISKEDYDSINKRSKVETGDILFSMIGNIGTIYKVEEKEIGFTVKNVAIFKSSQKNEFKNFIYMFLKSIDMDRYMKNVISGSIQKFIGLNSLRNTPVFINDKMVKEFNSKTNSIFLTLEKNKIENQKLSELRDWLLPMLMNGQVRIDRLSEPGGTF
jgi:restriction endonuclease S subunit/predicted GIY-YIG superfamily endonuclease